MLCQFVFLQIDNFESMSTTLLEHEFDGLTAAGKLRVDHQKVSEIAI
jgi:hypothetical protein